MKNKLGICSITFRELGVQELIDLVKEAGLDAIEWGADIHVKPGDNDWAKEVAEKTKNAGLEVSSYGAYYRAGIENEYAFEDVLETAKNLGAPGIRVWAGFKGSEEASDEYRNNVVEDTRRIARLAAKEDIYIDFEYHARTLTDTPEGAVEFFKEVGEKNVRSYWQPAVDLPIDVRAESIDMVAPWLSHIHVFQWDVIDRLDFEVGVDEWKVYLEKIDAARDQELDTRYFLMEFVKDNSPEQFLKDAKALKTLFQ